MEDKIFESEEYKYLKENGLIDEIAERNLEIRRKFRKKVNEHLKERGVKGKIRRELAEEYGIGIDAIVKILYSKHHNKKKSIGS